MTIAIVGYGKMGRMIEHLALERGIAVGPKLDEFNNADFSGITPADFRGVDVAIDFSTPSTVVGNIERIAALGVNLVIGTTGWQEHMPHVKERSRAPRYWLSLEPELFCRRERILPHRKRGREASLKRSGVSGLGVGNSSFGQERRAVGYIAEAGG